ncbi:MAG TPA: MBL fold metallo-hydrolase [Symbiobacteriaceae bacterium]|nr:MBL fold metallo-hydrolase [Symbiobacteriaceae bacterium]
MQLETIQPGLDLLTRAMPGSTYPVAAVKLTGTALTAVIDTLIRPADMTPFGSTDLVIYTHADWDHCWGTAAFPGAPIIGHRLTGERLRSETEARELATKRAEMPTEFDGSVLIPPQITFEQSMQVDLGGFTLQLHHLPGHCSDALLLYVPDHELVLAGDTAEVPVPYLNEFGQIADWAAGLRRWERAGVKRVIPSHGRPGGPELLAQTATYIEETLGQVQFLVMAGCDLPEIQKRCSVEPLLPAGVKPESYASLHKANLAQCWRELTGQ